MGRPLIAVPGRQFPGRPGRYDTVAAGRPYLDAVARAGGRPVVLTPDDPAGALDGLNGLLLLGGGDLDPATYGQVPAPELYGVDAAVDSFELAVVAEAMAIGMPVLGVCRGLQVLNVACGGSLDQHITGRSFVDHGVPLESGGLHPVVLAPGSRAAAAVGDTRVERCPSHHHQAVDRLGDGLTPVGWADDGLVEAVEHDAGWVVAVQWHPEETAAADPAQQALFDAFVRQTTADPGPK
jgi:putative glutamine amidotransferase